MPELSYVRKPDGRNRITIPGKIMDKYGTNTHFAIEEVEGRIILTPVKVDA